MIYKLKEYISDDILTIPITLTIPDQTEPVIFTIRAQISSPDLEIDPNPFELGTVHVNQCAVLPFTIKNHSTLPQELGFVYLPKEVEIRPNMGFDKILPFETKNYELLFKPINLSYNSLNIRCRSRFNIEYNIPLKANVEKSPVLINYSDIHLPAISYNDKIDFILTLTNISNETVTYEFQIPFPTLSFVFSLLYLDQYFTFYQ